MSTDRDSEDGRPHKRPRTDDPSSQPSTATADKPGKLVGTTLADSLKRHEEFWFDDGSVVLVARNTGFRVFRSLLAVQSTIFGDMLACSSASTEEMFAGCPIVHLSDSPEDVVHFLHVLLPKSRPILFKRDFEFSFHQISAVVRLAHKYHVQDVLEQALSCIEEYFTSSFDAWEARGGQTALSFDPQEAIGVINLARLVDRLSVLPIAFYQCALLGANVLKGYTREDKSTECLDQSDLVRCITGRNMLAAEAVAIVSDVFVTQPYGRCETPVRCADALKMMLVEAIGSEDASDPDVLNSWARAIGRWAGRFVLCDACKQAAIDRDTAARRRVWAALPRIFDIEVEGWNGPGSDGGDESADSAAAV